MISWSNTSSTMGEHPYTLLCTKPFIVLVVPSSPLDTFLSGINSPGRPPSSVPPPPSVPGIPQSPANVSFLINAHHVNVLIEFFSNFSPFQFFIYSLSLKLVWTSTKHRSQVETFLVAKNIYWTRVVLQPLASSNRSH